MKQPTDFYKAAAYRASEFLLKKRKLKMKHSEALELIAAIFNQNNWQTLNAIGQNEIDPSLLVEDTATLESTPNHPVSLLPFERPASPWKEGSNIFLNPEGELVPYHLTSTPEFIDPIKFLEARLKHEMTDNSRFKEWAIEDKKIRNSSKMLKLRKERDDIINKMNNQNKNNVIKIINLSTGEEVATYLDLDPKMALFAYVQGLKGFHNTWEYKEQIKNARFIEGKNSIALDDYSVLKSK